MCCWNINGNGKRGSEFICLSCLEWKTVFTRDIQRSNQREPFHIKDNTCLRCGEVKTMEVRPCDYLPDVMFQAMLKHNELYNDNIKKINIEHYGEICI